MMSKLVSGKMILALSVALLACGCKADIVVPYISAIGAPTINLQGSVEVPIRVTVANQGTVDAPQFKLAMFYETATSGPYVVSFDVPGQASMWYPYTSGTMAAAGTQTFDGIVTFIPSVHGVNVDIWAEGDSCAGDEFMPVTCRVDELDELNNDSAVLSLFLP